MAVYDDQKEKLKPGSHDDLGVHPERREAEVDDLENLYNAESAPEKKQQNRADEKEKTNLDQAEKSAPSTDTEEPDGSWDNKTGPKKKQRFSITGKQAAAGGGAIGLLVGGSIGFFTFMAGPLQFMQFAELLQRFHFDSSERFGNSRTAKLLRYATKTPQNAQNYNLSRTGNKVAVHYETKLKKGGIDIEYNNAGRMSRMTIDPDSPAGKKMIQGIEAENGVAMPKDPETGRVVLEFTPNSSEITSSGARRKVISGTVNAMGMNKISASLAKRMLKGRAGVSLHPLKNLARSADEKLNLSWDDWKKKVQDERAKQIQEGAETPDSKVSRGDDPDNPGSAGDEAASNQLDDAVDGIQETARDPNLTFKERVGNVRGKLTAGVGVAGIAATVCGLDALGDSVSTLQEENIVQPLIRTGMSIISIGSQIKSGEDISMDEIGAIADSFYDKGDPDTGKGPSSWMSAESIQSELGRDGVGVKMPDSAKPGKERPAFFGAIDVVTGLPGISSFCGAVNSSVGGLALSIGGVLSAAGGPAAIALAGISEVAQNVLAGAFLDDLVRFLAGPGLSIAGAAGGELGNYANFGAFLANNNSMKGMGGRALTGPERVALANERETIIKQENRQRSFYARMFDVANPDSLVSKAVIQNQSIQGSPATVASIAKSPLKVFGSVGSSLASLNPRVHAQTSAYDYGVDEFGFSITERDDPELDDPYANAALVEPKLDELNREYGTTCFGTTIDKSSGKITYTPAPYYDALEKNKAVCGAENTDPDFMRYRMYVADTISLATISCYEGIDEALCDQLGMNDGAATTNTNPATPVLNGIECPANMTETKQVGGTTYYKIPPAPGGEYTIYSRDARRYGQKELVCVLYTVAKAYKTMYGEKSTMDIGDLNAAGHKSHKWGVAVDLDAQGDIVAADNVNSPSKYSTEATIALGKLFVDTGYIKNIWYCSNDGAIEAIRGYAASVGKPITIKCISGHYNHFHVDINTPRGAEDTP